MAPLCGIQSLLSLALFLCTSSSRKLMVSPTSKRRSSTSPSVQDKHKAKVKVERTMRKFQSKRLRRTSLSSKRSIQMSKIQLLTAHKTLKKFKSSTHLLTSRPIDLKLSILITLKKKLGLMWIFKSRRRLRNS